MNDKYPWSIKTLKENLTRLFLDSLQNNKLYDRKRDIRENFTLFLTETQTSYGVEIRFILCQRGSFSITLRFL